MKRTFFGELIKRLSAETPSFFRKFIYFGIALGGIGAAIQTDLVGIIKSMPAWLYKISGYMIAIGGTCTLIAKMVFKDKDKVKVEFKEPTTKAEVAEIKKEIIQDKIEEIKGN